MSTPAHTSSPDVAPRDCVAVVNAGSSSIKFAIFALGGGEPEVMCRGQVEAIGLAPKLTLKDAQGSVIAEQQWPAAGFDHDAAMAQIMAAIDARLAGSRVVAVGHRVVHGGTMHAAPVRVTEQVLADLTALIPLAPLHQPHNLAPIRAIAARAPGMLQVACFDTAFHTTQTRLARSYGLPRAMTEAGVLRYGFHGLSYEYVARQLARIAPDIAAGRVVVAHLGNGASLCAMAAGRSAASTMGFTAVEGLIMGTRSGSVDPGVLLYLMDEKGFDPRAIETLLYRESGLLGVSGISSDMRTLRASDAPEAAEAVALFVYRIVREIGSMVAALGGIDALVFTAGIGENDAATRAEVAAGCAWLGIAADPARNAGTRGRISPDGANPQVWVVDTNEELMIAEHTIAFVERPSA